MARVFLDTNVIAYQFDGGAPDKQSAADRLLLDGEHIFVISTQVLLELFVVITRKLRPPLPLDAAQRTLDRLNRLPVVSADARLVLRAVDTVRAHQLSVWDAMIVEAAAEGGCEELWTEDLAAGSELRGVRIVNPFAP